MRRKSFMRSAYNYFARHWVLSAMVSTLPAYLFGVMRLFGGVFEASPGVFHPWALWFLAGSALVSFVFSLLKAAAVSYDVQAKMNGQLVFWKMLTLANLAAEKKVNRFAKYIITNDGTTPDGLDPFPEITQPVIQIGVILDSAQIMLADLFGVSTDDIGISLLTKYDVADEWAWLYKSNIDDDLPKDILLKDAKSATSQILSGATTEVFFPDKRIGANEDHYILSAKDMTYNGIGSIICKDVGVAGPGAKRCQAVLSISTYGTLMCDPNDYEAKEKILKIVVPTIAHRVRLELTLLYIKDVMKKAH